MKIALINQPESPSIVPMTSYHSTAIWTYEVTRRLAKSCELIVYGRKDASQKKVEFYDGIEYRRVAGFKLSRVFNKIFREFSLFPNVKLPVFASLVYYLIYSLQIAFDLKNQQCDIVHIHSFSQFIPIIRAFNPTIKIVFHAHDEWLAQLDHKIIEERLRQVDLVVCCSEYITQKVRQRFPQFAERCHTVFNGVETEKFTSKTETKEKQINRHKKLIFVGRVSPEKGVHVLLEAFEKVVAHYPEVQLVIVGPEAIIPQDYIVALSDDPKVKALSSFYSAGSYISHMKNKLPAHLENQVSFTGPVQHSELAQHYQDADLLINPSFSESFGMSLVEAMAAEVPVVASRVGGMTNIVEEGKTGLLVASGDATALAEAIVQLLSNEELRISMGKAGRQRVLELFSWDKTTENLLSQYIKLHEKHERIISKTSITTIL